MPPVLRHKNGTLSVDNSALVANAIQETYLTADSASGSGTITVKNITGFAVNQLLLIGEIGEEGAEIVKTHASSAPSGTTVTLAANTVRAHTAGTKVRVVKYDQVELSHAATLAGAKSVLTTANIQPDTVIQRYNETAQTTGYYFARYKDSIAGTFSGYTDGLEYGGWDENTVGDIIDQALQDLGLTLSEKITRNWCYKKINRALRLIQGKQLRWPEHYSYNEIIGQTSYGGYRVAMPTGAYDTETNASIIGVRIGNGSALRYLDPIQFDEELGDVISTEVRTQASVGASTLEIDNSFDFEDSGTVSVYISGTKYDITYTGVTRSSTAGVLTGIPASGTGAIAVTIPVDTVVWQNENEASPHFYTVRNGYIEFSSLFDTSSDNANIYVDYAKVATQVDSDGDTIDVFRYDMVLDYLKWEMDAVARNSGNLDERSPFYSLFKEKLNDAVRNKPRNVVFPMNPKINSQRTRSWRRSNPYYATDA